MNDQAELQADETPVDENQTDVEAVESTDSASVNENEDATVETEPGEKVEFTPEQQAVFDGAIGKKVKATREAQRAAEALREENEALKASIPAEARPEVPPMPDQFADDFDERSRLRDKAIQDAAAFDARQEALESQKAGQEKQAAADRQHAVVAVVQQYTDRATSLGISPDDLATAGNVVSAAGISDDVTLHILQDDKGPAITQYLAQNPLVMDELHGMNPMQAAVHIENVVKPAAVSSSNKTNAPAPSTNLDGGGSPPSERGPKGATFE